MKSVLHAFVSAALLGAVVSCGPGYSMTPPAAFKKFEAAREFKFITADGVMLKAREVANYPVAELAFWVDALSEHLDKRGYALKSKSCFETQESGLPGCTLDFVVPHGTEDWILSETLFVLEDRVILLEAAGPFDRFAQIEAELKTAFTTFSPKN